MQYVIHCSDPDHEANAEVPGWLTELGLRPSARPEVCSGCLAVREGRYVFPKPEIILDPDPPTDVADFVLVSDPLAAHPWPAWQSVVLVLALVLSVVSLVLNVLH